MTRAGLFLAALAVLSACGERPRFSTELEIENGQGRVSNASVHVGNITVGVAP